MTDDVDPLPAGGPTSRDLPPPAVALIVVAHPDDAEFQAGATLAKWARSGCEVHHLVLTDGSKGTWDQDLDPRALVEDRRAEQRAASAALGGTAVHFLDLVDGELTADVDGRGRVARVMREVRPDVVLGHDPWKRYRLHPDHRAAGWLAVDAVVAARDPHFFREQLVDGLTHHRPSALLLFEADEANHAEPADPPSISAKLSALEAHESQLETTHFYALDETLDDPADSTSGQTGADARHSLLAGFRDRERRKLAVAGAAFGLEAAEVFHLIDDL